jgi:hypothetical protein
VPSANSRTPPWPGSAWDVRVGVFPKSKEILIGPLRLGCVTRGCIRSATLEMGQCPGHKVQDDTRVVE